MSSEDWDGDKAKAKEQKSLIDFDALRQKTDMDIDEVPFYKLNLGQNKQKEKEPLEVTQSLVPPASDPMDTEATAKDETEEKEGQTDMEIRLQEEAEKAQDEQQNLCWTLEQRGNQQHRQFDIHILWLKDLFKIMSNNN